MSGADGAPGALAGRRILLIVAGGIAAFKSLELVRLLRRDGAAVRAVLTEAGSRFVTPLSLQALTEQPVGTELLSLTAESEMGHIQLSRAADLVVVAPASADLLARMAAGIADDLATTLLLATDKDVLVAPAMNHRMWGHSATVANMAILRARGVLVADPDEGAMACGEWGVGRLAEPSRIRDAIVGALAPAATSGPLPLAGRRALVTAGPTQEPIDPVRFIANRSSGRQGYAIAQALAEAGATVTLVSGPTALAAPAGVGRVSVETANEMLDACRAVPTPDVAVLAAAVADWRVAAPASGKLKKAPDGAPPVLTLVANPDILALLARAGPERPRLVIGFAAETDDVLAHARAKLARKGCDWILANDVRPATGHLGGERNEVHVLDREGVESWPSLPKLEIGRRLVARIAHHFGTAP